MNAKEIIELIVLFIYVIVGIVGNLMIIFAYILTRKLRTTTTSFIVNVAVSDFILAIWGLPTMIATILNNNQNPLSEVPCMITGSVVAMSCGVSILSLSVIAFNRYIRICKHTLYRRIFKPKITAVFIFGTWFGSLVLGAITYFGEFCKFGFDPRQGLCCYNNQDPKSCLIIATVAGLVVPMVVNTFCYFRIFLKIREAASQIGAHTNKSAKKKNFRHKRAVLIIFCAYMLFIFLWLPYFIVMLVDAYHGAPNELIKFTTWLSFASCTVNWILYGAMHQKYKQGYKNVFMFIKGKFRNFQEVYNASDVITDDRSSTGDRRSRTTSETAVKNEMYVADNEDTD